MSVWKQNHWLFWGLSPSCWAAKAQTYTWRGWEPRSRCLCAKNSSGSEAVAFTRMSFSFLFTFRCYGFRFSQTVNRRRKKTKLHSEAAGILEQIFWWYFYPQGLCSIIVVIPGVIFKQRSLSSKPCNPCYCTHFPIRIPRPVSLSRALSFSKAILLYFGGIIQVICS